MLISCLRCCTEFEVCPDKDRGSRPCPICGVYCSIPTLPPQATAKLLPVRVEHAKANDPTSECCACQEARVPLRVLVVEDHRGTAATLATMLHLEGHEVEIAYDGTTAIDMAQANPPDVALLDIGLPGTDGHQVAKRLREHRSLKRPLLVATTGYNSDEDHRRSAEAGIDLHLVKPVDPVGLRALLNRFRDVIL